MGTTVQHVRGGVLGAVLVLAAPVLADEGTAPTAVTAADVLRWHEAGATPSELLARVRVAPRIARSSVADLEALARARVPAELIVVLLQRGADASAAHAPTAPTVDGTLRLRARGPFDLHVRIAPGQVDCYTAHPGVEPEDGFTVIAAGSVERRTVAAGPYALTIDDTVGPRLRVPAAGVSALVVDAPGHWAFAEALAAGRTDEDPPATAPTSEAERDQQETYAARWARVTPELSEGFQGGTAIVHAGWRTRRPGVPRWYAHLTRYPHVHVNPLGFATLAGRAAAGAVVVRADDAPCHDDSARVLLRTGPYRVLLDPWHDRWSRVPHRDADGRLWTGSGRDRRPWVYRAHR